MYRRPPALERSVQLKPDLVPDPPKPAMSASDVVGDRVPTATRVPKGSYLAETSSPVTPEQRLRIAPLRAPCGRYFANGSRW